ncbi:MAG: alpha/beta hydrolase [Pseudomonadota bacterium]|nr:alpha/beta hydrolase [Pseudomonadota bacterium]
MYLKLLPYGLACAATLTLSACVYDAPTRDDIEYLTDESLPSHTIYQPTNLDSVTTPLPVVAWGVGGCTLPGVSVGVFLAEISAAGYLVVSNNSPWSTFPTSSDMLIETLDWAEVQNSDPASEYFGKLDVDNVALMGHSCGGLEALHAGANDPRVDTVIAVGSGIFDSGSLGGATKDDLLTLPPTLWMNGGPEDIAYPQAENDYADVPDYVPVVWANYDLSDRGAGLFGAHNGTLNDEAGGEYARASILWLDWLLKGQESNQVQFMEASCGLCDADERWSVQSKNW